ncbi:AI-2E family transporter [Paenibacillus sp. GCM10012307]|uniref:AI-2E family transporter n=1 Tax=Paenibacillus roseus TaxID=2798579 RepID=A0A934J9X4_9BACL|nr:AI-2E family transporter [Paenibacillus roseus]MBJ6363005.1 AI-2E family transporter [Paenibacillus roseus]
MLTFYQKYWRTAFDILMIVLTVYLIMYAFSFIYRIATPVILSFVIFATIEPLAKRLNRLGISKSIASALSILFFAVVIAGAFVIAGIMLTNQISGLIGLIPTYQDQLKEQIDLISGYISEKSNLIPPDFLKSSSELIDSISKWGTNLAKGFLTGLVGFLSSFSTFMFNLVLAVVLAYFLSIEISDWKKTAQDKTPNTFKKAFFFLKDNVFAGIAAYLKAQMKLISITFVVILAALLALGVKNAFTVAVVSAIFDILPLLGVSTVFIPWIIYLFIVGDTTLAIFLTVLLAVVILARQILEPKITGDSLGVSAFTTLVFMIVSLSLFGVAGVIISPVLVILIKALYDQGYLHQWIRKPIGEYDDPPSPPPAGDSGNTSS